MNKVVWVILGWIFVAGVLGFLLLSTLTSGSLEK